MARKTNRADFIRNNADDFLKVMNHVIEQHESLGIRNPIKFTEINKIKSLMSSSIPPIKQSLSRRVIQK